MQERKTTFSVVVASRRPLGATSRLQCAVAVRLNLLCVCSPIYMPCMLVGGTASHPPVR
jgi:hypothetical protein